MKQPYRIDKSLFTEDLRQEFDGKIGSDGTIDWEQIINKPQMADSHWKTPVATFTDLPITGNTEEDIRLVLDTSEVYTWNSPSWVLIGANDTSVDWTHLQNKPVTYPPSTHEHTFDSILNKPATYPPSPHTHLETDIPDLDKYSQAETDALLATKAENTHTHGDMHNHTNKAVLDTITNDDVTLWDTVSSKADQSTTTAALANKSDSTHLHDGRYYTQAQITSLLSNKSDITHSHSTYVHDQVAATEVWTIIHNLGRHPNVTVVDTADSVVYGDVTYVSNNQIQLTFSAAFSGKAYLN